MVFTVAHPWKVSCGALIFQALGCGIQCFLLEDRTILHQLQELHGKPTPDKGLLTHNVNCLLFWD